MLVKEREVHAPFVSDSMSRRTSCSTVSETVPILVSISRHLVVVGAAVAE